MNKEDVELNNEILENKNEAVVDNEYSNGQKSPGKDQLVKNVIDQKPIRPKKLETLKKTKNNFGDEYKTDTKVLSAKERIKRSLSTRKKNDSVFSGKHG